MRGDFLASVGLASLLVATSGCPADSGGAGATDNVDASTGVASPHPYSDLWCLEREDGLEVCDGWDNDCDGAIDEDDDSCHCGALGHPCAEGFECHPDSGHCLSPDGLKVYIPGGTFWMGCNEVLDDLAIWDPPQRYCGGWPQHPVHVPPFVIDTYPVTVADWRRCVQDGTCPVPEPLEEDEVAGWQLYDSTWYRGKEGDDYPITRVNWYEAQAYCAWAGGRLCSEAEWEKAARGGCRLFCPPGDGACCAAAMPTFPWGEERDDCEDHVYSAWLEYCSPDEFFGPIPNYPPEPVDAHPAGASPFGVMDAVGNALQWTLDTGCANFGTGFPDGAPRDGSPMIDPSCDAIIAKGNPFSRPAHRVWLVAREARHDKVSVRCCTSNADGGTGEARNE